MDNNNNDDNDIYRAVATLRIQQAIQNSSHDVLNERVGQNGETLLHLASRRGDAHIVRDLLNAGADLEIGASLRVAVNHPQNNTPLHMACFAEQVEIVRLLLEAGANFSARNSWGATPLHLACHDEETCRLLLEAGANVNTADMDGWTPLHNVSLEGPPEAVRFLLEAGADANIRLNSDDGDTPLHLASINSEMESARLLLDSGADVNASNDNGETPLHAASQSGNVGIFQLLLDAGADLDARDSRNATMLHIASEYFNMRIVRFLVERGETVYCTDHDGHTPFDRARIGSSLRDYNMQGRNDVMDFLLGHYRDSLVGREGSLAICLLLQEATFLQNTPPEVELPIGRLASDQFFGVLQDLAIQDPESIRTQNTAGELAIHVACRTGASNEVIRFLVQQDSATLAIENGSGALPLHLLICGSDNPDLVSVQHLVQAFPASVSRPLNGDLPVMLASERGASVDVLFLLMKGYPDVVFSKP